MLFYGRFASSILVPHLLILGVVALFLATALALIGLIRSTPVKMFVGLIIALVTGAAVARDLRPSIAAYRKAVLAYLKGSYGEAYIGALNAAAYAKPCIERNDPTEPLTQEQKALWASYFVAAVAAGLQMPSYPNHPRPSELRSLLVTAINAATEVRDSPYAAPLSKNTARQDLQKMYALMAQLDASAK